MKTSILLIDDEDSILKTVSRDLEAAGYTIRTARSGAEGIAKFKSLPADVVITDLCMEGMDGVAVLKEIRKIDPETAGIILTAYGSLSTVMEAMQAGIYDYLLKPCDRKDLMARVGHCLEKRELQRKVEKNSAELRKAKSEMEAAARKYHELEKSLRENTSKLEQSNEALKRIAALDETTGIASRRIFDEHFEMEWRRAIRDKAPLSVILMDVDFLNCYNEVYGMAAGDDCLRRMAHTARKALKRPADMAARYSGGALAALLPETGAAGALAIAEEMRGQVEAMKISHDRSPIGKIATLSLGVATLQPAPAVAAATLIRLAEKALYEAKTQGRNRSVALTG